jgi:hemerythrin-like domain-containing protein
VRQNSQTSRGYVDLLRQHIAKEDGVLFRMADRVLRASDQRDLEQSFERIETEVMGPGTHERYHRLLDDLEHELGLG